MERKEIYDCIIVGGGPAGITAGIYLARANKKVLILEKYVFGGVVAEIGLIENYPGYNCVSGFELAMNMYKQAQKLGVTFLMQEALFYDLTGKIKKVKTNKTEFEGKTVILAMGSVAKPLNVDNEQKYLGKGLSYCATCDGNFFKNKIVGVVGSGDGAISTAQYLSGLASKVYIISKYDKLQLKSYSADVLEQYKNIEVLYSAKITALEGEGALEKVKIEKQGREECLQLDGLFISAGRKPDTATLKDIVLDENGYILSNLDMRTNVEGVFVAGDVVSQSLKQIVVACSSGAIAGTSALKYLLNNK